MITLHAFSGKTGAHMCRLAWSALTWSDSINEAGSISATVVNPACEMLPYGLIIAAIDDGNVRHAGYLTKATFDPTAGTWSLTVGGGLTIFDKRLVLNRSLKTQWKDGTVIIDEDNPPGAWVLTLKGSYRDIIRGLISETTQWGTLPFSLPAAQGGSHERTYNCWDLAKVSDRISDIGDLEDGVEFRFDAELDTNWNLKFALRAETEIIDTVWTWNSQLPGQELAPSTIDYDGSYICTQSFGTGGKEKDELIVAHATGGVLEAQGFPVLQMANTSHTTISQVNTLKSYVNADVAAGDTLQECQDITCPIKNDVRVGDWINLRDETGVRELKVTDVSGDASSGRLTVSTRPRG